MQQKNNIVLKGIFSSHRFDLQIISFQAVIYYFRKQINHNSQSLSELFIAMGNNSTIIHNEPSLLIPFTFPNYSD